MPKTNFSDWTRYGLEKTFTLVQVDSHLVWDEWWARAQIQHIDEFEQEYLLRLRNILTYRGDDWNETELVEQFIGPLLTLINFNTHQFAIFAERELTGTIGDYEFVGKPDAIIAQGRRMPEIPYFCLHEYKREFEPKGDPAGQALAAMLVVQELNQHQLPVYGLYVAGDKWRFMVLKATEYYISHSFTADSDTLFDIFKLLKALKEIIIDFQQVGAIRAA